MLSIFPELYNYSHIAPFLLRLAVGVFFLIFGFKDVFAATVNETQPETKLTASRIIGILELLASVFLLIGLFVQPTAMAMSIILIAEVIFGFKAGFGGVYGQGGLRFFLLAVLLSLIVLGPGIFSLDLPL